MHIPVRDLWWLVVGGAGYGTRYVRLRLGATRNARRTDRGLTERLLQLQTAYGYNAHSLVSIAPGARLWAVPEIDGAIIYSEFGHVWLAAGDPVAAEADMCELARGFIAAARKQGRVAAFVPTTARFARMAVKLNLGALKIGAAPYFDLQTWQPRGDRAKKMRAGINQAQRAGVTVTTLDSINRQFKQETQELCRRWLATRRTATGFGWLFLLDPFLHAELKRYFAARDATGQLLGLLAASPIPARAGWYLEDVLRHPTAPPGTNDLLVVEALKHLAADGAQLATLGTAPLAPEGPDEVPTGDYPHIERALTTAAARLTRFYNFDGLRRFKAKFVPTWWESEYVLVPHGATVPPRVAYAILRAIAPGGLAQLLTRQVAISLRARRG
jgi:phosphatidylglycerol lysyltransferase